MAKKVYTGGMPAAPAPKYQVPHPDPGFSPMERFAHTIDTLMDFARAGGQLTMAPASHPKISSDALDLANDVGSKADALKAAFTPSRDIYDTPSK